MRLAHCLPSAGAAAGLVVATPWANAHHGRRLQLTHTP